MTSELPDGWNSPTVGSICGLKYGKFIAKKNLDGGEFPVFSGYGVVGTHSRYLYEQPEVIVVCRGVGGSGDIKMSPPKSWVTNLSIVVRPKSPNTLSKHFLYWALLATDRSGLISGSAQYQVTIAHLERHKFNLPPLDEQCRIASVLGVLDDKIELNRKMNRTLEEMARVIFKSRFIDFDGVPESEMVESELGPIPNGWEVKPLSDVADMVVDCLHSKKPPHVEGGRLMLQVFNIGPSGRIDWSKTHLVSDADHSAWCRRIKPRQGDLFISKTGRVGAVAQLLNDLDVSFGRNLVVVRPSERLPPNLFRLAMLSNAMRREILRMTSDGTVLKSIHVKHINQLRVVLPPLGLVTRIEANVEPLSRRLASNDRQSNTLAALRDALLPKLISGEIRVPEAEKTVEAVA